MVPRLAIACVACLGLLAAGCGRDRDPDLVNGKALFVQKCGSCHTLQRANTTGVQAPDLDQAFGPARRQGLGEGTVEGVVRQQIASVRRNSTMPANLVTGDDAQDVAAYVAEAAGQPGQDQGALAQAGRPKVSKKPVRAKGDTLAIDADPSGALAFTAIRAIAKAGSLTFVMKNEASVQHNIALRGPGGRLVEVGPVVGQGGTSRFTATVERGKFAFVCTVPGHEEGGMKGELTVR